MSRETRGIVRYWPLFAVVAAMAVWHVRADLFEIHDAARATMAQLDAEDAAAAARAH